MITVSLFMTREILSLTCQHCSGIRRKRPSRMTTRSITPKGDYWAKAHPQKCDAHCIRCGLARIGFLLAGSLSFRPFIAPMPPRALLLRWQRTRTQVAVKIMEKRRLHKDDIDGVYTEIHAMRSVRLRRPGASRLPLCFILL